MKSKWTLLVSVSFAMLAGEGYAADSDCASAAPRAMCGWPDTETVGAGCPADHPWGGGADNPYCCVRECCIRYDGLIGSTQNCVSNPSYVAPTPAPAPQPTSAPVPAPVQPYCGNWVADSYCSGAKPTPAEGCQTFCFAYSHNCTPNFNPSGIFQTEWKNSQNCTPTAPPAKLN